MNARLLALLIAVSLVSAAPELANSDPLKVAIVSRTVFYVPAWIAERKGFFSDEGLAVDLKVYNNAEAIDADLRAGRAQISISTPESVVGDVYRGGSLRIIAGNAEKPPHFIITKKSIASIKQLKGARIGVLSLKEGTTYLVRRVAETAGLKPDDYELVAVGGAPTRWRLLKEGRIDAGLQPFPLSYEAEAAGFNNLGPVLHFVPHYQFTSVNVDSNWAVPHVTEVAAFLRALQRGLTYAEANPDEASAIVALELRTSAELARRALDDTRRLKILSSDLSVSSAGLEAVFDALRSAELVPANSTFQFSKIVDQRYLEASKVPHR